MGDAQQLDCNILKWFSDGFQSVSSIDNFSKLANGAQNPRGHKLYVWGLGASSVPCHLTDLLALTMGTWTMSALEALQPPINCCSVKSNTSHTR